MTDQSSVVKFIEDNWLGAQRLGQGSFDQRAGSITTMFDFVAPNYVPIFLHESTGLQQ